MTTEMSPEEQAVHAALVRFYEGLYDLVEGRGMKRMDEAWHHTPRVTVAHPLGEWSHGWDEVRASWDAIAAVGSESAAGAQLRNVRVHLYGDVAYTTAVFVSPPKFGSAKLNCTNILHKSGPNGGEWKIIHHHPDKSPSIEAGLEKMAEET